MTWRERNWAILRAVTDMAAELEQLHEERAQLLERLNATVEDLRVARERLSEIDSDA